MRIWSWRRKPRWRIDFEGVEQQVRQQVAEDIEAYKDTVLAVSGTSPGVMELITIVLDDAANIALTGDPEDNEDEEVGT